MTTQKTSVTFGQQLVLNTICLQKLRERYGEEKDFDSLLTEAEIQVTARMKDEDQGKIDPDRVINLRDYKTTPDNYMRLQTGTVHYLLEKFSDFRVPHVVDLFDLNKVDVGQYYKPHHRNGEDHLPYWGCNEESWLIYRPAIHQFHADMEQARNPQSDEAQIFPRKPIPAQVA